MPCCSFFVTACLRARFGLEDGVVWRDHSLAVVVRFFVLAGYQPLGVAGQRVVCSY